MRADAAEFEPAGLHELRKMSVDLSADKPTSTSTKSFSPSMDAADGTITSGVWPAMCTAEDMGWCSTAVPSPALTAMSAGVTTPWGSPYWGMMDNGIGMWQPQDALPDTDQFVLPEATESTSDEAPPEFAFSGLDEFENTMVSLLANLSGSKADDGKLASEPSEATVHGAASDTPATTSDDEGADEDDKSDNQKTMQLPPGLEDLAPPPGLPLPPGLEVGVAKEIAPVEDEKTAIVKEKAALPAGTTTVMLRNIPNKYTQSKLIERLHEDFRGDMDFLYLPVDFKNKCNVGYAFVNFRTTEACERFVAAFHLARSSDKLPGFNSQKICEVSPAKFQGQVENIRRLQSSPVMSHLADKPEWQPQLFDKSGKALEFPLAASNALPQSGRTSLGRGRR